MHGGQYNIGGFDGQINFFGSDARKLKDSRYQGWFVGAGIAYGYAWILGRHWNLEAEIGFGYSYTRYDRFQCAGWLILALIQPVKQNVQRIFNQFFIHGGQHAAAVNAAGGCAAGINLVYVF